MSTDSPSTTDRLAAIRAHFEAANVDVPLDAPMKERTARVSAGIGLMSNGREYTEFLLSLVDILQERLDTAEGQLATAQALHQPKTIYTEWHEFPVESSKRTICERCTGGDPDDYYTQMVLWPCENAKALGLDGGGSE